MISLPRTVFWLTKNKKRRPLFSRRRRENQRIRLHYCTHGELARCQTVQDMVILLACDPENQFSAPVSYLLPETSPEWRAFAPAAFAASVRTHAYSTVRAGDFHPFSFSPAPDSYQSLCSIRLRVLADLFSWVLETKSRQFLLPVVCFKMSRCSI